MRNVLGRFVEQIKIHILYSVTFFPENRVDFEMMWKSTVEQDTPQMTTYLRAFSMHAG
jgi:hypothetical protein